MPPETPRAPRPSTGPAAGDPFELEGGRLVEAYAAIDSQFAPEAALLDACVDEVAAESPVRRATREEAVAAAVSEVLALTRDTICGWLAAAAQTAEARAAGVAADESLVEDIDALVSAWGEWAAVAEAALATLATAQRAVVIRALARFEFLEDEDLTRHVGGSSRPARNPVKTHSARLRVRTQVEWLLDLFAHPHQMEDVAAGKKAVCEVPSPYLLHQLALRESEAEAEEWADQLEDLWDSERQVRGHARSLRDSWDRIDQVRQNVVAARHRAHAESCRRAREEQEAARAQQQAEQAAVVAQQVETLTDRAEQLHQDVAVSSSHLRQRGWKGLFKQLCDGSDELPGLPREAARPVLGLTSLAADLVAHHDHPGEAADRLRDEVAAEDRLMADQRALAPLLESLPVADDTRQAWGAIHPRLRDALEWVRAHWEPVRRVLAAEAPDETAALERLLAHLPDTAADRTGQPAV